MFLFNVANVITISFLLKVANVNNIHVAFGHRAPVAQLVEHRAVTREVVSSTPAGPTLRVFK